MGKNKKTELRLVEETFSNEIDLNNYFKVLIIELLNKE